jgi:hypothetical protein
MGEAKRQMKRLGQALRAAIANSNSDIATGRAPCFHIEIRAKHDCIRQQTICQTGVIRNAP